MSQLLKKIIYKTYVIALIGLVIWVAQFIYPLIFWEFEHTGIVSEKVLDGQESPLQRIRKIRHAVEKNVRINKVDLGDRVISEQYVDNHFHHIGARLDEPAINGCDYCHTLLPHRKDREIRAFLNMHGFFNACETCHVKGDSQAQIEYGWLSTRDRTFVKRPAALLKINAGSGEASGIIRGNYGARIVPWYKGRKNRFSILEQSPIEQAREFLVKSEAMSVSAQKKQLDKMHRGVAKKPLECDSCHSDKSIISYDRLGYSEKYVSQLADTAIVGMIKKYKQFHFPNLFIRKDDRKVDYLKR